MTVLRALAFGAAYLIRLPLLAVLTLFTWPMLLRYYVWPQIARLTRREPKPEARRSFGGAIDEMAMCAVLLFWTYAGVAGRVHYLHHYG
jgi:hypothetical protein